MKSQTKEFDQLNPEPARRRVSIYRASEADLVEIYPRVAASLAQHIAKIETCECIRRQHADNFWSIRDNRTGSLTGIYAMVMLTEAGRVALLEGRFQADDPQLRHVAVTGSAVSAIYKWAVFAPGGAAAAIALIAERLKSSDYVDVDLFGTGATDQGRRIMRALGFRNVQQAASPLLFTYRRLHRSALFRS